MFKDMQQHGRDCTLTTFNVLLQAADKAGNSHLALDLLQQMQQSGIRPTPTSYAAVIGACAAGEDSIATVEASRPYIVVCQTCLCWRSQEGAAVAELEGERQLTSFWCCLCAAAGMVTKANELLNFLETHNTPDFSTAPHVLMSLCDKCCKWASAYSTYEGVCALGVRPDNQAYTAIIEALWGAGSVVSCQLALRVFEEACKNGAFR